MTSSLCHSHHLCTRYLHQPTQLNLYITYVLAHNWYCYTTEGFLRIIKSAYSNTKSTGTTIVTYCPIPRPDPQLLSRKTLRKQTSNGSIYKGIKYHKYHKRYSPWPMALGNFYFPYSHIRHYPIHHSVKILNVFETCNRFMSHICI